MFFSSSLPAAGFLMYEEIKIIQRVKSKQSPVVVSDTNELKVYVFILQSKVRGLVKCFTFYPLWVITNSRCNVFQNCTFSLPTGNERVYWGFSLVMSYEHQPVVMISISSG